MARLGWRLAVREGFSRGGMARVYWLVCCFSVGGVLWL